MDKQTAFEILKKSSRSQEILIDEIFRNDIVKKNYDYKKKGTLEFEIYKGLFNAYHTILQMQDKIFQVFPELKQEFETYKEKKV